MLSGRRAAGLNPNLERLFWQGMAPPHSGAGPCPANDFFSILLVRCPSDFVSEDLPDLPACVSMQVAAHLR